MPTHCSLPSALSKPYYTTTSLVVTFGWDQPIALSAAGEAEDEQYARRRDRTGEEADGWAYQATPLRLAVGPTKPPS